MSRNLAFIPARGGSKGIPSKNLVGLRRKPLIYYSIAAAQLALSVDKVLVSTDNPKIAAYADICGAEVIHRPEGISGDDAQIEDAINHALVVLNERYDNIILLQPTSPLRRWYDIDRAVFFLEKHGFDSLFSASPINPYVWDTERPAGLERVRMPHYWPRLNRQDMAPLLDENGSIYVTRTVQFLEHFNRLCGRVGTYEMPQELGLQIDDPIDLVVAEALLEHLKLRLVM